MKAELEVLTACCISTLNRVVPACIVRLLPFDNGGLDYLADALLSRSHASNLEIYRKHARWLRHLFDLFWVPHKI